MNPQLVDASLKKKLFQRKTYKSHGHQKLIQDLEQLEDIGVITDVLKVNEMLWFSDSKQIKCYYFFRIFLMKI